VEATPTPEPTPSTISTTVEGVVSVAFDASQFYPILFVSVIAVSISLIALFITLAKPFGLTSR